MLEEELINLISGVGFPIAITVYLLFERSKGYKELCAVIEEDIKLTQKLIIIIENKFKE
jgi:hypothetical protein